jgi:hypothetical protein
MGCDETLTRIKRWLIKGYDIPTVGHDVRTRHVHGVQVPTLGPLTPDEDLEQLLAHKAGLGPF